MTIEQAKQRVTIYDVWRKYFPATEPRKLQCSPFRHEKNPSFSICYEGRGFRDFADGTTGDVVDFVALCENCDKGEAIRKVIDFAGGDAEDVIFKGKYKEISEEKRKGLAPLPQFDKGRDDDFRQIMNVRGWETESDEGLRLLEKRGLLRFATIDGIRYWFILDSMKTNVQMRRVNGEKIMVGDNWVKAKTWPGSQANWLIGQNEACDYSVVLWTEGGPDFLASSIIAQTYGYGEKVGYVCQTGAHQKAKFNGRMRRLMVFVQDDMAGYEMLGDISYRHPLFIILPVLTGGGDLADWLASAKPADEIAGMKKYFEVIFDNEKV